MSVRSVPAHGHKIAAWLPDNPLFLRLLLARVRKTDYCNRSSRLHRDVPPAYRHRRQLLSFRCGYSVPQHSCRSSFSRHSSASSFPCFFLFCSSKIFRIQTSQKRAGLKSSPVFGVSLSSLCISTVAVSSTLMVTCLSAGRIYPEETLSLTSDTVYSPIRRPSMKISPFLSVLKVWSYQWTVP